MDRKELIQRVIDRYGGREEELLEIIQVGIERLAESFIEEIESKEDELDVD